MVVAGALLDGWGVLGVGVLPGLSLPSVLGTFMPGNDVKLFSRLVTLVIEPSNMFATLLFGASLVKPRNSFKNRYKEGRSVLQKLYGTSIRQWKQLSLLSSGSPDFCRHLCMVPKSLALFE